MIDGMIRQARNIALGLRPPLLDEAGLVAALDHHLKALAGRSGVRIELDAANGGRERSAGTEHDGVPPGPGGGQQCAAARAAPRRSA